MNASRRKDLDKAFSLIEEAKNIIETCKDAEQDAFDGIPENMQHSDRGSAMEEAIGALEEAEIDLENVLTHIETAKGEA